MKNFPCEAHSYAATERTLLNCAGRMLETNKIQRMLIISQTTVTTTPTNPHLTLKNNRLYRLTQLWFNKIYSFLKERHKQYCWSKLMPFTAKNAHKLNDSLQIALKRSDYSGIWHQCTHQTAHKSTCNCTWFYPGLVQVYRT